MHSKRLILFSILLFCALSTFAQREEVVTIITTEGETIEFRTKLRKENSEYVFPNDNKDFIQGYIGNEKTKLEKSTIYLIELKNGTEYEVFKEVKGSKTDYHIGYYLTKGKIDVFKTYDFRRDSNSSGSPVSFGVGVGGVGISPGDFNNGPSTEYYLVQDQTLAPLNEKKDIKRLSAECVELARYLKETGKPKKDYQIEDALKYYNTHCD